MTRSSKHRAPGGNRPTRRVVTVHGLAERLAERPGDRLGEGVDRAINESNRIVAEVRAARDAEVAAYRDRSAWDPDSKNKPWPSAKPAGAVRRLTREQIDREYDGLMRERALVRLAKETRAYAKLDEINERWERRGKP